MIDAITVSNLDFSYGEEQILSSLEFNVRKGEFLAIAGPNGAGKSSLLNLLTRTIKPSKGNIALMGRDIRDYNRLDMAKTVSIVRQDFSAAFGFNVYETVMMARTAFFNVLGFESSLDRDIVENALEATNVAHLANRDLNEISTGERQRVFIARALAQETPIILLDEPTSFLDLKHQVEIYDLLKQMQLESSKTIVTVTHDINLSGQYCDKVLLLGYRDSFYLGDIESVFEKNKIAEIFSVRGLSTQINGRYIFLTDAKHSNRGQSNT